MAKQNPFFDLHERQLAAKGTDDERKAHAIVLQNIAGAIAGNAIHNKARCDEALQLWRQEDSAAIYAKARMFAGVEPFPLFMTRSA